MIRYFSVDEEFSGLDHRKNDLLSIGIIEIEKRGNKFYPMYNRKLYLELKPEKEANEESMAINKLNLDNLKKYGINKDNFVREVEKYLNLKNNDKAVFVAYCGVLDKIFFDQIYQDTNSNNPFDYEIIEISSLAIGKLGFEWGFTEQDLLTKLGIPDTNNKHNALDDAILQALEFCGIMNY